MGSKIDRVGEENVNNFGSKMIIVEYRMNRDIDVYFPEYNWTFKHTRYNDFKKGNVKCPYERRVFGIGYLGEGKYKTKENGRPTKCYSTWRHMLQRCYNPKYKEKHITYENCEVDEIWHNLQSFGDWYDDNYYEIDNQKMCLDKDILHKGNKIYSPDNCIFVPERINTLFTKRDKSRGEYPIGVSYNKQYDKFQAYCRLHDFKENKTKLKHLGYYDNPEQAFEAYKEFKENYVKEVADYYKDLIPIKLHKAMYEYEVNIED